MKQPLSSEGISRPQVDEGADPGPVMTKRAIRRRIVKNWERKQKELRSAQEAEMIMSTDFLNHAHDVQPHTSGTVHSGSPKKAASTRLTDSSKERQQGASFDEGRSVCLARDAKGQPTCVVGDLPPFEFFFRSSSRLFSNFPPHRQGGKHDGTDHKDTGESESDDGGKQEGSAAQVSQEFYHEIDNLQVAVTNDSRRGENQVPTSSQYDEPSSALPIPSMYETPHNLPAVQMKRVERQEPLPLAPFAPGTDLNKPTQNYLTPDAIYGIHRHAPGFSRDEHVTTSTLLSGAARAMLSSQDRRHVINVVSTGEALKSVFETAIGSTSTPLSLHVHRLGPAVVLRAPEAELASATTVAESRKKALLGKALYRMKEIGENRLQESQPLSEGMGITPEETTDRVGTVGFQDKAFTDTRLHSFSNLLHWGISGMEVVIGLDTPILVDRSMGPSEELSTFLLHDVGDGSVATTNGALQRDALRCWFEATMANVSQVGICIHNRGIVQSYELKKVSELLTMVEGHVAAAAMAFTTNVLSWLLEQCTIDGADYIVIKNDERNTLELYSFEDCELLGAATQGDRHELRHARESSTEPTPAQTPEKRKDTSEREFRSGAAEGTKAEFQREGARVQREKDAMNVAIGTMCYRMGIHLVHEKPVDSLRLILRSFQMFFLYSHLPEPAAAMLDMSKRLALLMGAFIKARLAGHKDTLVGDSMNDAEGDARSASPPAAPAPTEHGTSDEHDDDQRGGCSAFTSLREIPEVFKEALTACIKVENRVRYLIANNGSSDKDVLGAVPPDSTIAAAEAKVTDVALHTMLLHVAAAVAVVMARSLDYWPLIHKRIRELKASVVKRQRDSAVQLHCAALQDVIQVTVEAVVIMHGIVGVLTRRYPLGSSPSNSPTGASCPPVESTCMIDMRMSKIDISQLVAASSELLGDIFLNALSDRSPLTATTISEVSALIKERRLREGARLLDATGDSSADGILSMLARINAQDPVSTFFCAVRHFGKTAVMTKRLLTKTGHCYFLVGQYYNVTDRSTKALEALHRSHDMLSAAETAVDDTIYEGCTQQVSISRLEVQLALGQLYLRIAAFRHEQDRSHCTEQAVGRLHPEEERSLTMAVEWLSSAHQQHPQPALLTKATAVLASRLLETTDSQQRQMGKRWLSALALVGRAYDVMQPYINEMKYIDECQDHAMTAAKDMRDSHRWLTHAVLLIAVFPSCEEGNSDQLSRIVWALECCQRCFAAFPSLTLPSDSIAIGTSTGNWQGYPAPSVLHLCLQFCALLSRTIPAALTGDSKREPKWWDRIVDIVNAHFGPGGPLLTTNFYQSVTLAATAPPTTIALAASIWALEVTLRAVRFVSIDGIEQRRELWPAIVKSAVTGMTSILRHFTATQSSTVHVTTAQWLRESIRRLLALPRDDDGHPASDTVAITLAEVSDSWTRLLALLPTLFA